MANLENEMINTNGELQAELKRYSGNHPIMVLNDHTDEEYDIEGINLASNGDIQILIRWK